MTTPNTVDAHENLLQVMREILSEPDRDMQQRTERRAKALAAVEASARALAAIPAQAVMPHGLVASGVVAQKSTDVSHNAAQQAGGVPAEWREEHPAPYRCLKPHCPPRCSGCNHAIPVTDTPKMIMVKVLDELAVDERDNPYEEGDSKAVDAARAWLCAPSPSAVQPLSQAQIEELRGEANRGFNIDSADYLKAFRDAERAHGIKESSHGM